MFTAAEQALIAKASQDLYRYERICTEHSAISRRDVEALTKAHQEYKANSLNRMGEHPEKVLKADYKTVLEYYAVYKFDGVIVPICCFL